MKTHFSKLIRKEAESKLYQLHKSDSQLVLWEKSEIPRFQFKTVDFDLTDLTLLVKKISFEHLNFDKKYLGHFSLNGLSFFFECQIKKEGDCYLIYNIGNFYKAERRTSFRLLTYPHRKVYLKFTLEDIPKPKPSNVVSIETGESQTGLFVNFLELMGEEFKKKEEDEQEKDVYDAELKLRVQDVSLTGLCFEIGELEKAYLEKNPIIEDIKLEFNEVQIVIPKMEVVYIKEHENFLSNMKNYRVGVRFRELEPLTERLLNKKIKSYIEKIEAEYEDILEE
ncbi:MAG: PilZ domain-containing protein [Halobacteriovoraceae bacterium]|nr:PilZ domain-containing protein [Halobacteriovoraceae bacterium]